VKIKIVLTMALAAFAFAGPLAGDGALRTQMCWCEFEAPAYRNLARMNRREGTVLVIVKVHNDGTIAEIWPLGTEMTPEGPFTGIHMGSLLDFRPSELLKNWKFCAGGGDRYVQITFQFKLTDPPAKGWAPTHVSFHAPATVEISTAHILGERTDSVK
jgi:hypothetical protein